MIDQLDPDADLLQRLNRCPPFMVYYGCHLLHAKHLTVNQIAFRSGLKVRTVLRTAYRESWAGVKVSVMAAFCRACGVDLLNPDSLLAAVRKEIVKSAPFENLPPQRRAAMLTQFNILCGRAVEAHRQMSERINPPPIKVSGLGEDIDAVIAGMAAA
jgi:hypothetical protein